MAQTEQTLPPKISYKIEFKYFQEDGQERWLPGIEDTDVTRILVTLNNLRIDNPKKEYRLVEVTKIEKILES